MELALDDTTIWTIAKFSRADTLGSFVTKTQALLSALRGFNGAFATLAVVGKRGFEPVSATYEKFYELVASHAVDVYHMNDYVNLSADGRVCPDTLSRIGFSLTFLSLDRCGRILPPVEGGIEIRVQGCSAGVEPTSSTVIRLPMAAHKYLRGRASLLGLLALSSEEWHSNFGGAYVPSYRNTIQRGGSASYAGQWLFYLPFPHLASCLPPDIHHEPFANGILIQTTPHLPNADNPDDVAAGKRVRDVLDEFGLVNDATYAIEGWPPDDEEAKYEQYISGAPSNRKYTVHCINFDGYDPDRKVLLYAKLFRRLKRHPKEWGHRGWDGPVLNEAKRQVKAAAKAGGVAIEWHIGLEEPAHQVRQLLADYTQITEQQLKVIYTPLEQALANALT